MAQKLTCVRRLFGSLLLIGILGLTAIALLTRRYGWPIYLEVLSHFQVQYFVLSILCLMLLALCRQRRLFWMGLLCTAILGASLAAWYLPPKFLLAANGSNFRLLIANLNTQNKQYEAVLQFTRQMNPDLALFMEVDEAWVQQLNTLSDTLPYSSGEANPYNSGIIVYSRSALANPQIVAFGEGSTPSITGSVTVHNQTLEFVGTHPWPPVRSEPFHSRNRQLDQLGQYVKTVAAPKILMGDLNLSMWSPYYKRLIRNTELKNARQGFGILPSWPTPGSYHFLPYWAPLLFAIPIDHCLLSPDIPVVDVHTGPNLGSDHRPVVVDLQL